MKHRFRWLWWLPLFSVATAWAQSPPAGSDPGQQRRLAEQKLKLVEMLIEAPATQARLASGDAAVSKQIEQSRTLTGQARTAIASQQYEEATRTLDEALRGVFKTSAQPASAADSERTLRVQHQDFLEQIAVYRATLLDMQKDSRHGEAARKLLARVDRLVDDGRAQYSAGHLADSNRKLADAYKLAVSEISQLRAGQEVVMSLKFDSPADEFAYELKRYQSNELLVRMMVSEGKADGERGPLVDGFVAEAARLNSEARRTSQAGDAKAGIATMEKANAQLNRALQSMGVPVF